MKSPAELLVELLSLYTPTYGEAPAAGYLREVLLNWGHNAYVDEAGNVVSTRGEGGPVLWLHAHMDTVPGYIPVKRIGEKIFGRGAVDDKGPLVAALYAYHEAHVQGTLVLSLVTAEEGDSRGTKALMSNKRLPPPDGIIVLEPTDHKVVYGYRGSAHVVLRVLGRSAHSSSPVGENPIYSLCDSVMGVVDSLGREYRYGSYTATPTMVTCGDYPNKVPRECTVHIDVRIPPTGSCEEVRRRLPPTAEVASCVEPVEVDPSNPVVRALSRAQLLLGRKPLLARKLGTSDMNLLVALTRNIAAYGPGDPQYAHTEEEHIDVRDLELGVRVLRGAVEQFWAIAPSRPSR